MTADVDTIVIGAGAAGLTAAKLLADRGAEAVVLDDHDRVGDPWRERYRSLRLFSPRALSELPGLRMGIGYFSFGTGVQVADYLEEYARRFALTVRARTAVTALTRADDGAFVVHTSQASELCARRVVVAVGAHRIPVTPPFAESVSPAIRRLHSVDYRGPEQLAPGDVLVVGAGNAGTDIALEAAAAGHRVVLAGRHPGQVPGDIDTPIGNLVARIFIRRLLRATIDTERGRALRERGRGHGVNLVRNTLRDLDRAGIRRVGRITGVDAAGLPVASDSGPIPTATVVWCTGSRPDFSWLRVEGALDERGWPDQYRGMVRTVPGLAFVGLPFQHSPLSPTLLGIRTDARYVVDHLLAPGVVAGRALSSQASA